MKKLKQKTSINHIFFTLFLLFKQILCLDPNFNLCIPKDCGDGRSISFPFFIRNVHDSLCGHPSFAVQCNSNGSAVFNMSQNEYKVKDIEYDKKIIRVQNTAVPTKNSRICENLNIGNFTINWQFSINNRTPHQNLVIMSNCSGGNSSSGMDPGLDIYRAGSCEKNSTKYAMLENDMHLKNMTGRCGVRVETPVEVSGDEGWRVTGTNYDEVIERGFEMTWQVQDCGECEQSGGRCGFNATARVIICFCSDRPHRFSCKSGEITRLDADLSLSLCVARATRGQCIPPPLCTK